MTASAGPALKELHSEFGDRVQFLTIYVREAHPGERFPQPSDLETKRKHAERYVERDGVTWPVAIDDVEGSLHRKLDEKPHSAYLLREDGHVAARFLWANHARPLREAMEALLGDSEMPESREDRVVPMLRGLGLVHETLEEAGDQALVDLRREAPPMWAMAWTARRFRPLSPLARGATAAGIGVLAAVGLVLGTVKAFRAAR